eukprot:evm.model.scf_690.5 EVM.evm.TU.scf_690.5   scf_690:58941-61979(-)
MAEPVVAAVAVGVLVKLCEEAVERILPIIVDAAAKFGQERTEGLHDRVDSIAKILKEFQNLNRVDEAGEVKERLEQVVARVVALEAKLKEAREEAVKWDKKSALKKLLKKDPRKHRFKDIDRDLIFAFTELTHARAAYLEAKVEGLESGQRSTTAQIKTLLTEYETTGKTAQIAQLFDDDHVMESAAQSCETEGDAQLLRYNKRLMTFLKDQLEPVRKLLSEPLVRPVCISEATWHQSMDLVKKELARGDLLIDRHRVQFCLKTFYSTADAKRAVERICGTLKAIVGGWAKDIREQREVHIEEKANDTDYEADQEDLCNKLAWILNGAPFDFEAAQLAEWENVRKQHEERMKRLKLVKEDVIVWQKKVAEGTWEATYCGQKVTVKWLDSDSPSAPTEGEDLDIISFAKLLAEIMKREDLNTPYVAPIYGVTKSGRLVFGRSDTSLRQWLRQDRRIGWPSKTKVLLEAALGLEFVHEHDCVHSIVNSESFLMFDNSTVKIADFSCALDKEDVKTLSARSLNRPVRYIAPEIFEGRRHSSQSDTYSFGVVMHEVASGQTPYGVTASDNEIMAAKLSGQAPCIVPSDCPPGLASLMQECCSLHPTARPTMQMVRLQLDAAAK